MANVDLTADEQRRRLEDVANSTGALAGALAEQLAHAAGDASIHEGADGVLVIEGLAAPRPDKAGLMRDAEVSRAHLERKLAGDLTVEERADMMRVRRDRLPGKVKALAKDLAAALAMRPDPSARAVATSAYGEDLRGRLAKVDAHVDSERASIATAEARRQEALMAGDDVADLDQSIAELERTCQRSVRTAADLRVELADVERQARLEAAEDGRAELAARATFLKAWGDVALTWASIGADLERVAMFERVEATAAGHAIMRATGATVCPLGLPFQVEGLEQRHAAMARRAKILARTA